MSTFAITHPSAASASRSNRAAWLGFLVVLISAVMDLLDSTIAQTAAPAIRRELGGSYADLEWISAAYTLAMSVTMLLGSRLGDILGRRRVLLCGIGGFVAASALCALAPSPSALIVARGLQGTVAAIMVPQGFGLIRELFGDAGQQKAFGVFGPVMGLAAVAGPPVGGGLVSLDLFGTGWRMIFAVNIPLGLLALAAGRRFLPRTLPATPDARPDGLSVGLAMAGAVLIVYPLIEPSILRRRPYVAGLAVVIGAVATLGIPVAAIAGSITSSALLPKIGRMTMHIGTATMTAGLVLVIVVLRSAGGPISAWDLAAPLAVTGYGMGMVFVPMFDVILAGVAPHELGSASGLLESVQQLAMSVGIAVIGTVLFGEVGAGRGPLAFMGAASHALLVTVAFLLAAGAAVFWLPKHARESPA